MPTYEVCPSTVKEHARQILNKFESHAPLLEHKVRIDLLFAFGERDDEGELVGDAITQYGRKCLGLTRKLSLKDRTAGRGDAEILLDGDWWKDADDAEKEALLDHQLHHLSVKMKKSGGNWVAQFDVLGRPLIKLRKHDVEVGWFNIIAQRHGSASQERQQAETLFSQHGQLYFPEVAALAGADTGKVTRFASIARGQK